jgi:cysteine synthase
VAFVAAAFRTKALPMLDLRVDQHTRARAVVRARERGIVIPTLAQQIRPTTTPVAVRRQLSILGLWDVAPANLFRINWQNQATVTGGDFGAVNTLELPSALTGVPARIVAVVGRWFPTGAHKVGAAFGCLVPRLVSGGFDPSEQLAVWPSTGNFCRGGAYDSALLGCQSVAILPEGMSQERFDWLGMIAGRVVRTPGTESNVKEIFDACQAFERRPDAVVFNQFADEGNYLWHHCVTGSAMLDVIEPLVSAGHRYRGLVIATGSAGTLASGDRLKAAFPESKIVACEPVQCPTMLCNGYGSHRIEGIGDKHIPWIHNTRTTDMVIAVDDAAALALIRLFNEPAGQRYLTARGVPPACVSRLTDVGISGAANILACAKFARWYDLGPEDIVLTVFTDSIDLYRSRLRALETEFGSYRDDDAAAAYHEHVCAGSAAYVEELTERSRRRLHNLKYFTWVEQRGKSIDALNAQWHDRTHWQRIAGQREELDALIAEFNRETGVLAALS